MDNEEIIKNFRINILKRKNHITVATSTSREKDIADFVLSGDKDEQGIMQAIDDLPIGGGTIEILDGEILTSSPIVWEKDSVVLVGQGIGDRRKSFIDDRLAIGTRIVAQPGFVGDSIIKIARQDRPVAHTKISDFTIDGNGENADGIRILTFRGDVTRIAVFECINGLVVGGLQEWNPYDTNFSKLLLAFNKLDGMHYNQYSPDSHAKHG